MPSLTIWHCPTAYNIRGSQLTTHQLVFTAAHFLDVFRTAMPNHASRPLSVHLEVACSLNMSATVWHADEFLLPVRLSYLWYIFLFTNLNIPLLSMFCRRDIIGAISWGLLCCFLIISSYMTLYFRHFWLSAVIISLGILLPAGLYILRQRKLAKKRERRLLLPLSM